MFWMHWERMGCPRMSPPLILIPVNRHTLLYSQAGDILTCMIGLKFSPNCTTEIMFIAGLSTNVALSLTYVLALRRFIRQSTPHHVFQSTHMTPSRSKAERHFM